MKLSMQEAKKTSPARKIFILALVAALTAMGLFYWYNSGRIVLQGAVSGALLPVNAEMAGQVSKTFVLEGETVARGQALVQMENNALKEAYLREEQARLQMEASIPPHVLMADDARREELSQRLEQEQLAEQAAHNFLREASVEEARTAVNLRRATIQRNEKRISEEQFQEFLLAHSRAKRLLEAARADQERASTARARTTAELRRLQNILSSSGHDEAATALLKAYELQSLKAHAAADALNASIIRAPHAGIVAGVTVQPGSAIAVGETALFLLPTSLPPSVIVYATAEEAAKLRPGMPCSVSVPASAVGPLDGEIAAVLPNTRMPSKEDAAPAEKNDTDSLPFRVHVRLSGAEAMASSLPGADSGNTAMPLMLMDGSRAEVTVYLNKTAARSAAKSDTAVDGTSNATSGGAASVKEGS